ncbi:MAG: DUF192 domain-containing protein [Candidatus Brockarchaeota archaeon]|nr:DUF192 domain-containing protein [Candidatus Brockarchaeota archaeon]
MAIVILFLISALVLVLVQISSTLNKQVTKEFQKMETSKIKIVNDENKILELEVRIADEPDERAAGFQNISRSIMEKTIILFVFPSEINGLFHMRNVEASLDIAFVKANGTIIEIMRMDPDSSRLYGPNESFKYAIEVPLGFFKSKK